MTTALKMDNFSAAMIADGEWSMTSFEPSEENFHAAFQHLIDTGLAWQAAGPGRPSGAGADREWRLRGAVMSRVDTTPYELACFSHAYIECALWSSDDESEAWAAATLLPETRAAMLEDCRKFFDANYDLIEADNYTGKGESAVVMAGHDFWLTRCGHGAGFWDGDWAEPAAGQLTEAAKAFGDVDLYVGDDGKIWA